MKNPSPGSCRGGLGRPGDGTVPTGAALTTTTRRTPVACIARMTASVPGAVMPASAADRGPRPDRTASAPWTADSSTDGSGAARSAVTTRTPARQGCSRTAPATAVSLSGLKTL